MMNNKSLDALFTGLTGSSRPLTPDNPVESQPSKVAASNERTAMLSQEKQPEERFCTIVQSETLRKIRIIANREGLQIKDVVGVAFEKAIKSYERKHGTVDGGLKGDASNLF